MMLYHFTGLQYLRGIADYGLTVGDVPTDLARDKGVIGVWFTSKPTPDGNGLEGSRYDKRRIRLGVEFAAESRLLHKWTDWSRANCTPETIRNLHETAEGFESWFICLGVVRPERVSDCYDMLENCSMPDWRNIAPNSEDVTGVPAERREAWQKKMLKSVRKERARRN
jgi:hypothetical protein